MNQLAKTWQAWAGNRVTRTHAPFHDPPDDDTHANKAPSWVSQPELWPPSDQEQAASGLTAEDDVIHGEEAKECAEAGRRATRKWASENPW